MKVNVIQLDIQKFSGDKNNKDMIYLSCPKSFDYQMVHKIIYGNIPKKFNIVNQQYVIDIDEYLKYLSYHGIRPINPLVVLDLEIPDEWNNPVIDVINTKEIIERDDICDKSSL